MTNNQVDCISPLAIILVLPTPDRKEMLQVWRLHLPPKIRRRNNNTGLLPFGFLSIAKNFEKRSCHAAAVGNHFIFTTMLVLLTLDREEILLVWDIYLPPKIRRRNNNTGLLPFGFFTKFPFTQYLRRQNWSEFSKNSDAYVFLEKTAIVRILLVHASLGSRLEQ